MRHNGEGMGRSRAGALFPSVKKQQRKWRCEEVDKDNGGLVQFLALLEIFQMILGNLKSQTPTGWKRPPKVCSSTSCTRQVQLDQVVGKFSVSPRMEIPQTIRAPVPVFDHPHVIFFSYHKSEFTMFQLVSVTFHPISMHLRRDWLQCVYTFSIGSFRKLKGLPLAFPSEV